MKVLVTGAYGAAGSYLANMISHKKPEARLYGFTREVCDLRNANATARMVGTCNPDWIFHLASNADLAASFKHPGEFIENNVVGTSNILDAIRSHPSKKIRFLLVSSCEVYGPPQTTPISEDHPFNPISPYAVSKASQDLLGRMYHQVYGTHVVVSRLFNYINPRRKDLFATSFARQIAEIEAGKREEVVYGNLDSARTLLDVRDVVRGYWDLLEKGTPGEAYNIGAPAEVRIGEVLETLCSLAHCKIKTRHEPNLMRPTDIVTQIADMSKFEAATGWTPRYTLQESLKWLLQEARENVG